MREHGSALQEHHWTGARQIDPLLKLGCSLRDHTASGAFGVPVDHGPNQTSLRNCITADLHRAVPMRIAPNRVRNVALVSETWELPSSRGVTLTRSLVANETVANGIALMHLLPRLGTPEVLAGLAAFLIAEAP